MTIKKTDEQGEYIPVSKMVAPDGASASAVWAGWPVALPGDQPGEMVGYFVMPLSGSKAGVERLKAIQEGIGRFEAWQDAGDSGGLPAAMEAVASVGGVLFGHYAEETREAILERLGAPQFREIFEAALGAAPRLKVEAAEGNSTAPAT